MEILAHSETPWKKITLKFLVVRLQKMWGKLGSIQTIDLQEDFFLVGFSNENDYSFVKGHGSFFYHYLLIQRWRPFFNPKEHCVRKVAMWVQILMLPKELYNKQYLIKVRNLLGNMMNIDENIFVNNKRKFARICVELDLRKELVPSFLVFGRKFKLDYERHHLVCFHRGKYGHKNYFLPK